MHKNYIDRCFDDWDIEALRQEEVSLWRILVTSHEKLRETWCAIIKNKIDAEVHTLSLVKEKRMKLMWLI